MASWIQLQIFCLTLALLYLEGAKAVKIEDFTDVCLDGQNHKSKPGPENSLFNMCSPWKKRSCCTNETSVGIHTSDTWLGFNWNHCQTLSARCKETFTQDLCFYECSPNLGPWLVKVNMKIRNNIRKNVPLCQSVCTNWWNDCKNDLTCKSDWSSGFNWNTGTNTCPAGSQCKPFHEIYHDANDFCEQVWGHAWKVVPDTQSCMHMWFDADQGNPNDKVAHERAKQLVNESELSRLSCMLQMLMLLVVFILCF